MLKGVYTALVTPFNRDGSVDFGALKNLLKIQIDSGIHGLVPVGTTGESPTLDTSEKEKIIQAAVEAAAGRIPVIAGTGGNNTGAAVEATRRARDLGADFTLQVTPYYNKPSEEGLYRHFSEIAEKGGLPVVLYNVPGRSAVGMSSALILRLAENSGIVAVKEASGSITGIMELLNRRPAGFSVLSGDDALTLPLMGCGGEGVISVASNMFPREMVELTESLLKGDYDHAKEIHNRLYPFFINQFIETNPVPIKTYMASQGLMEEIFRLPLCPLKEGNRKVLLSTFA